MLQPNQAEPLPNASTGIQHGLLQRSVLSPWLATQCLRLFGRLQRCCVRSFSTLCRPQKMHCFPWLLFCFFLTSEFFELSQLSFCASLANQDVKVCKIQQLTVERPPWCGLGKLKVSFISKIFPKGASTEQVSLPSSFSRFDGPQKCRFSFSIPAV